MSSVRVVLCLRLWREGECSVGMGGTGWMLVMLILQEKEGVLAAAPPFGESFSCAPAFFTRPTRRAAPRHFAHRRAPAAAAHGGEAECA